MRTCRIYALARFFLGVLAFGAVPTFIQAQEKEDIRDSVYQLSDKTSSENKLFYVKDVETWKTWAGTDTFTQTYNNGTLVFGNDKAEKGSGTIHIGKGGLGYINARFNAKDIYLTGKLITGYDDTRGGADIVFKATNNFNIEGFEAQYWKSGTQGSNLKIYSDQAIDIKDSKFLFWRTSDADGARDFILNAKNGITMSNTTISTQDSWDFGGKIYYTIDAGAGDLQATSTNITQHHSTLYSNSSKIKAGGNISFDKQSTFNM